MQSASGVLALGQLQGHSPGRACQDRSGSPGHHLRPKLLGLMPEPQISAWPCRELQAWDPLCGEF